VGVFVVGVFVVGVFVVGVRLFLSLYALFALVARFSVLVLAVFTLTLYF